MKKIIPVIMLLMLASAAFSQQNNPSSTMTKQDYLKKSKNQKKVALIMLGGGTTLMLTGAIIPKGPVTRDNFLWNEYKNDGIRGAFVLTGFVSMLGSIPFFIASSKNKRKAASVHIHNEKIQTLQKGSLAYKFIPAVRLMIRL
jgi:hypothetical protein